MDLIDLGDVTREGKIRYLIRQRKYRARDRRKGILGGSRTVRNPGQQSQSSSITQASMKG